jgi:hypothetical protein
MTAPKVGSVISFEFDADPGVTIPTAGDEGQLAGGVIINLRYQKVISLGNRKFKIFALVIDRPN